MLAPLLESGLAVFGDVSKHDPVGRARIGSIEQVDGGADVDGARTTANGTGGRWSVTVWAGSRLRVTVAAP